MSTRSRFESLSLLVAITLSLTANAASQVNVTTYHNDNARTGQNTAETALTPQNVNVYTFGKLFTVAVDGQVYAQPLVLSGVTISGVKHNIVYVATENDTVYAIDANNGTVYWHKNFIPAGYTTSDDYCGSGNITGGIGITGTPVIDTATNTIYFVTSTKKSGVGYYQQLHALDVVAGGEKFGGPVTIAGSYGGTTFNAEIQLQRPGLLLLNGHVVIAFGQHCTNTAYGWVVSYNKSTLAREAIFNTNPGTTNGSVWMGGDGVAADPTGNIFFSTGDGLYDASDEFGDSIIKLGQPSGGAFPFLDYFTPHDQGTLNSNDWDVGSGGVLVLPDLTTGSHPHLLVQAGKEGTIYLVDRTNMGTYCGSPTCADRIVQELTGALVGGNSLNLEGVWGSPAYWNGYVYFGSGNKDVAHVSDYIKAYSFNAGSSGVLSTTPTSHTPEQFAEPAPSPSISSNGTSNGILWAIDSNASVMRAYNATNLATELYNTNTYASRDQLGGTIKFSVPTVANGLVYVGGNGYLAAYGGTAPTCIPTTSCGVFGPPPNQTVAGGISLQCGQAMLLSASATICGNGCVTNSASPPQPTTSVGAGDGIQGGGGSCSLSWSWPYGSGSQFISVP
ncbi:MAG TPA: PQQ-binding-like beta-propeller repeat protein [Candidatus Dormibacteraeota bacterium]|nr:PQQ-binding-like beta-propeller repeat protein [Candidatus Dormibacteraeota bacterium]